MFATGRKRGAIDAGMNLLEVRRSLAPVAPNVTKLPPGGPPPAPRGIDLDRLRVEAEDALHTYLCAATGYDHDCAMTIFRRVRTTLDNQLAAGHK